MPNGRNSETSVSGGARGKAFRASHFRARRHVPFIRIVVVSPSLLLSSPHAYPLLSLSLSRESFSLPSPTAPPSVAAPLSGTAGDELCELCIHLLEVPRAKLADGRPLRIKEEDSGKVPSDVSRKGRLCELPSWIRLRTIYLDFLHESTSTSLSGEPLLCDKRRDLRARELLRAELVGRVEQDLDLIPVRLVPIC